MSKDAGAVIVKLAAEVGSKTALDVYAKQKEKERRKRIDRRLRDTKRLMKNYWEIKVHAGDAISSLAEVEGDDYDFFKDLMESYDELDVQAIVRSKARSAIMLAHIDAMLRVYEITSCNSKNPIDGRRYRVLEAMCLREDPIPVREIAEAENIDDRTVYKDLDAACEKMSALLFGIQWIERG